MSTVHKKTREGTISGGVVRCKVRILSKVDRLIDYIDQLTKWKASEQKKNLSNQYLVRPAFAFKTALILQGTCATRQVGWPKTPGQLTTYVLWI